MQLIIKLNMDENLAEIVMTALIIYAELMAEEEYEDVDQADVDAAIERAKEVSADIGQAMSMGEVKH